MAHYKNKEDKEFQRKITNIVKRKFPKHKYAVECDEGKSLGKPDIVVKEKHQKEPLPPFIFEVYHPSKEKIYLKRITSKKEKQIRRYKKKFRRFVFLVIPDRLSSELGTFVYHRKSYFVIAERWFSRFLDFIKNKSEELRAIYYSIENVFNEVMEIEFFSEFLSIVGEGIYKCPFCSSNLFSLTLYLCPSKNEFYHPDHLDMEGGTLRDGPAWYTYAECEDCLEGYFFMGPPNFRECPICKKTFGFQCLNSKCGAIFDKNMEVIRNFHDPHLERLAEDYPYYREEN